MSARFPDAQLLPQSAPSASGLESRLADVARRARKHLGVHVQRGTLGVTLVAVILGVYLAAQWQSKPRRATAAPEYRREVATATIERLEAEQAELKKRIADLRGQIARAHQPSDAETDVGRLATELAQEKLLAGTVAVRGTGIRLTLDDSAVKSIPAKEDPALYIVHEYQLRDIVNVLWDGGAEAISINGERVVEPTSIYCVGSTILVNDTRTSPPYEFAVIGDTPQLEAALSDPSNLKALKSRIKLYGLQFGIQRQRDLSVPAYSGGFDVKQAMVGTDAPRSTRGSGR